MIIQPINVATVTSAVVAMMRDHLEIGGRGVTVERAGIFDFPPGTQGWVGVYRNGVRYPPRALGLGAGFRQQRVELIVMVRESNYESGEKCEDALEELIQRVMSCLLSDPSLKGTVDVIGEDVIVTYGEYLKEDGEPYVQTALVRFEGVTNVDVA